MDRTDKVTKLRVLVGMLGLDPSPGMDKKVYGILSQAEDYRLSEEWVKVVAGLIRGVMFVDDTNRDDHDNNNNNDTGGLSNRESCRGLEAQRLLEKTCDEILENVLKSPSMSATMNRKDDNHDPDPLFSPYYYSLLNPDVLETVAPHCLAHDHFNVRSEADILKLDEALEKKRLEEGADQAKKQPNAARQTAGGPGGNRGADSIRRTELPTTPGVRAMQNKAKAKPAASRSSMFMASKRPVGTAAVSIMAVFWWFWIVPCFR